MHIKLKFTNKYTGKNLLIFWNKEFNLSNLSNLIGNISRNSFLKLTNSKLFNQKKIISFNFNIENKIILLKADDYKNALNNEKLGAKLYNYLCDNFISSIEIPKQSLLKSFNNSNFLSDFIFGVHQKAYNFEKYKKKTNNENITFLISKIFSKIIFQKNSKFYSLLKGIEFTKNLVSEPGNVLHPDEYVKRIKKLKSDGLKITILDKKKLKQLGMNALLGVGQGSSYGSYLAIIEWNGLKKKSQPLAIVGKGVCFDTGGISLKPAKFMEDMTYDMAGSAVVVGLMKTLALRKAKVNAVGVVGLVENMPDGNAQRPGDIVKSYSGKTIEILNTDAEGRLVLADALTYTEKKYKPKFIIDLATLTGAIIVSLGSEYAGLFSNNDKLSDQLSKVGEKVGEKVWRMPLNENYDKLIDSKKADMQNINYVGGAGSTTAAQFLQRFILNKTPWAHLDIAGMAFSKYGGALNSGGATGYGVRLLNQLIEDNYE
jgi:leucyl aminopeptidase